MESVELRRRGARFLALDVPGLAEKRPSLVQGDFVFAKVVGGDGTPYQVRLCFSVKRVAHNIRNHVII